MIRRGTVARRRLSLISKGEVGTLLFFLPSKEIDFEIPVAPFCPRKKGS